MKLDQIDRRIMLRNAHRIAGVESLRGRERWAFVRDVCGVGSTSAQEICAELGWAADAPALEKLPE